MNHYLLDINKNILKQYHTANPLFFWENCVFETMNIENKRIFLLEEHINRLQKSAKTCNIFIPEKSILISAVDFIANQNKNISYLRITARKNNKSTWKSKIIYSLDTKPKYSKIDYEKGVKITIIDRPVSINKTLSGVKGDFLYKNFCDREKIIANGYREGIYLTKEESVAEGCVSNIFWIKNRSIFTPSEDICMLAGITRNFIIKMLKKYKMNVLEGCFDKNRLFDADEIFLTNSLMGILPVSHLSRSEYVMNLAVGELTKEILNLFAMSKNRILSSY